MLQVTRENADRPGAKLLSIAAGPRRERPWLSVCALVDWQVSLANQGECTMSHTVMKYRKHPRRPRRALLRVEQLEDRSLLSGGGINVQILATLGDPAPGPGTAGFVINDFEPNALNNRGDVLYGADLG